MHKRNRKVRILWDRVIIVAFVVIISICLIIALFWKLFGSSQKPDTNTNSSSKTDVSSISTSENTINANYDYKDVDSEEIHKGNLILVNNKIPFVIAMPDDVVSVGLSANKNYHVKDLNVSLKPEARTALIQMIDGFYADKKVTDLMVISGFRTKEYQQTLYTAALKKENATVSALVALPGHSEHHTGYAVDFGIYNGKKEYDGTGNYAWINENCYKYGYIWRYQTDKASITGISNEPWHFRYVGQPHATLVSQNKFCYEEYIDYLKQFTFGKNHLKVTDLNQVKYEIYFIPVEATPTTKIPVPKGKEYSISGNNVDGFIVTVKL